MTKITQAIKDELRRNLSLPAKERMTDKEFADKYNVSRWTILKVKQKYGMRPKYKPEYRIGTTPKALRAFISEYDHAGIGNKQRLVDKYGFKNLKSMHNETALIRRMLNQLGV